MISLPIVYISSIILWNFFIIYYLYSSKKRPVVTNGGPMIDFFSVLISYIIAPATVLGAVTMLILSFISNKVYKK